MGKINWQRVLLGGLIWAVVYNVLGAASWYLFFRSGWTAALAALERPFQPTVGFVVLFLLITLVVGVFTIWLYAAIRPRYGPGPKTAVGTGAAVWLLGALLPTVLWGALLWFPVGLLVEDLVFALVVTIVCTLLGAWPYTEGEVAGGA